MIAASEEMHDETLEFSGLIQNLNVALAPRGIELKRVKWNPDKDGSKEDFMAKLNDCEMCLAIYWKELASNANSELNDAYQKLKDGNNPRKLYVFFKEPSDGLSENLKDFKTNFVTNYGHFFCKFENVDTMKLHFVLQFEAYHSDFSDPQNKFIRVKCGKVWAGDKEIVNLDKIPFAALNKKYQQLEKELQELDIKIADVKSHYKTSQDDSVLDELVSITSERKKKAEEYEKYQNHLYDIALNFAKSSYEHYSERMAKAQEMFEQGNAVGADQILNIEEMKHEAERSRQLHQQDVHNLEIQIEEFRLKANTVLANTSLSMPERFSQANMAYQEAIKNAETIHYDEKKKASLFYDYASLLDNYNRPLEAIDAYHEALKRYLELAKDGNGYYIYFCIALLSNIGATEASLNRYKDADKDLSRAIDLILDLTSGNPKGFQSLKATILNNLGNVKIHSHNYREALICFDMALTLYDSLEKSNPGSYLDGIAETLLNLGNLQKERGNIHKAVDCNAKALKIFRGLAKANANKFLPNVAMALHNIANLQVRLGKYKEAASNYNEALKIFNELAKLNPDVHLHYVAQTMSGLSDMQEKLGQYQDAVAGYHKVYEIHSQLAKRNPGTYLPAMARDMNNLAVLQWNIGQYHEAASGYNEALKIYRYLAKSNSEAYFPNIADTLNNLAVVQERLGQLKDAWTDYNNALDIYRALTRVNQTTFLPQVADTLNNRSLLLEKLGKSEEAEKGFLDAIKIFKSLPKKYSHCIVGLARVLKNLAQLHTDLNRFSDAAIDYHEVLGIYQELAKSNPRVYVSKYNKVLEAFKDVMNKVHGKNN